jgi:prepilin-type N-terminal cleavage/methylation domain-containing protein
MSTRKFDRGSSARAQRGFTLVEIAVVLLIVGLLLGGVLKGAELVASARVSNLAQSVNGYQAAVLGFQDRYRRQPGDSNTAAAMVGNGAVNCATSCNDGTITPWANTSLVNNHLSAAGFYKGPALNVETNAAPTPVGYQTNSNGGAMFVAFWSVFSVAGGGNSAVNRNAIYTGSNLSSKLLAEFDRKTDDGNAWTGSVRSAWPGSGVNVCWDAAGAWREDAPAETCAAASLY